MMSLIDLSPVHKQGTDGLEVRESCDILRKRYLPQRGFWEDLSAASGPQLVKCLPGMCEAPGSVSSTTQTRVMAWGCPPSTQQVEMEGYELEVILGCMGSLRSTQAM